MSETINLAPYLEALEGTGVPPAKALGEYMYRLLDWNEKINLTGAKTPKELAVKHIADVWGALSVYTPAEVIFDVGSGGGIPGIPLAVMVPALAVTLVERRQKKASVISSIISHMNLDQRVRVMAKSFEEVKPLPKNAEFWFRGFLPGPKLAVFLSENFPRADLGQLVLMKGPAWSKEKAEILSEPKVKASWRQRFGEASEVPYELPEGAGERQLVLV